VCLLCQLTPILKVKEGQVHSANEKGWTNLGRGRGGEGGKPKKAETEELEVPDELVYRVSRHILVQTRKLIGKKGGRDETEL